MWLKKKIKDKSGITAILLCLLMVFIIALISYILDGGRAYCYKTQLQSIADSMSVAGAQYGCVSNTNDFSNAKLNLYIDEGKAEKKAKELYGLNMKNSELKNVKVEYNLAGKGAIYTKWLSNAGIFHVKITAQLTGLWASKTSTIIVTATTKLTTDDAGTNITKISTFKRGQDSFIAIKYANGTKKEFKVSD